MGRQRASLCSALVSNRHCGDFAGTWSPEPVTPTSVNAMAAVTVGVRRGCGHGCGHHRLTSIGHGCWSDNPAGLSHDQHHAWSALTIALPHVLCASR